MQTDFEQMLQIYEAIRTVSVANVNDVLYQIRQSAHPSEVLYQIRNIGTATRGTLWDTPTANAAQIDVRQQKHVRNIVASQGFLKGCSRFVCD